MRTSQLHIFVCLLIMLTTILNAQVTPIDEFIGVNIQRDQNIEWMSAAGFIREYHAWVLDEGYPALNSINEAASPGYPNNLYKWNKSYQLQTVTPFDQYYQEISDDGILLAITLMQSVPYITNPALIPQYFDVNDQLDQQPIVQGADPSDPNSYLAHADWQYHFAARYGSTVLPQAYENQIIAPKLHPEETIVTGLGTVTYIENWNEPDKWWIPQYPSTFFEPEEYAAMLSADYDGHDQTMGLVNDPLNSNAMISAVGIKNADPNMKVVTSGLSDFDLEYLEDMMAWFETNRSPTAEFGQYPFDVISIHHYSNDAQTLNQLGVIGISPEADRLKEKMLVFTDYRDLYFPDKELWLAEFGYDLDPLSQQRVPWNGIGNNDRMEVHGQWIVRSYLEAAAARWERAIIYELRDACDSNSCGLFQKGGLVDRNYNPRAAWYYVYTMKNVLEDKVFEADLSPCQDTICTVDCPRIYKFNDPTTNEKVLAVWSPTSCDKSFNYPIFLDGAGVATLVEMQSPSTVGVRTTVTGSIVNVNVTERPVFLILGESNPSPAIACPSIFTSEETTCSTLRVTWGAASNHAECDIWYEEGNVAEFNTLTAKVADVGIDANANEYTIAGLNSNSTYTLFFFAKDANGYTSEPCSITATTASATCQIEVNPEWIYTSSHPNLTQLFDEQNSHDPICGAGGSPTSKWGFEPGIQDVLSVSVDLQDFYFIDAFYLHDLQNFGTLSIEYAPTPNGPWTLGATYITEIYDEWFTLDNPFPANTPIRYLRFTDEGNDRVVLGEVILCGRNANVDNSTVPPAAVVDLAMNTTSCNSVSCTWTAPFDNDLAYYEISYSPNGNTPVQVPLNGTTITYETFDLDTESNYTFTVVAVDIDGNVSPSSTITGSTLPASECNSDCNTSCDCKLCLRPSWIYDLTPVSGIDATRLVDEQANVDPICGSGTPTTEWGENYQGIGVPPAIAIVDLQQCHRLESVHVFDGSGTGIIKIEYQNTSGDWVLIENYLTNQTNIWYEKPVNIITRRLRFTKTVNQAKINEIAICGYPLNCENCTDTPDSDNDGISDDCDTCPGFDDFADSDNDGIPNGCDTCTQEGDPCDDGDFCTENDSYNANCDCFGTPVGDSDNDGVCDALDICIGFDDNIDVNMNGLPDGCEGDCSYLSLSANVTNIECNGANNGAIDLTIPTCPTSGGGEPTNLAFGKIAYQSSIQFGFGAYLAVDGNTSGDMWGTQSVASTNWENQAWWEVDLGTVEQIQNVEIWNRTDCCDFFMANYNVFISETPFLTSDVTALQNDPNITAIFSATPAGTPSSFPINTTGRFVRVQLSGTSILNIAEVIVMGGGSGGGTCTQSINWDNGLGNIEDPSNLAAGVYNVTVSDTYGCSENATYTITEPTALTCNTTINTPISNTGASDGSATASATGGTAPYTYFWQNGAPSASINGLSAGTYAVTITDANNCTCTTSVTLDDPGCTTVGDACDDGDACTINDAINAACNCEGTFQDSDNDGVCDNDDQCAGFDDNIDSNNNGIPDGCDTACPTEGNACDDGDACTINDVINAACNCEGTFQDSDNDGVCDNDDQCPGSDDTIDTNNNGIPDGCDQTSSCTDFSVTATATDASCFGINDGSIALTIPCNGTGGGGGMTNLALAGTASQSSENPNWNAIASRANDGNTSGNFWLDYSISGTGWQNEAWWQVDLGQVSNIDQLKIWNRTDCCQANVSNYYIFISDQAFTTNSITATENDPNVTTFFQAETAGTPSLIGINTSGRYVRIQRQGTGFLTLAEVEVIGGGGNGSNCDLDFVWTNGIGNIQNPNNLVAGNYNVTVTNNTDNCTATASATINSFDELQCISNILLPITTNGGTGTMSINGSGGAIPYTYAWSNGSTTTLATGPAGTYTVTLTDANGCTCTESIVLDEPAPSGIQLTCPANITTTIAEGQGQAPINWNAPNPTTTCVPNTINLSQTGMPNGSLFPVGVQTVSYTATDMCSNSETCSFSITISEMSTPAPTGYCASQGTQPWQEYIKTVQFNSIDHTSFKERYGDFTDISTTANRGATYPITLTPGWSWLTYDEYWRVWMDYNRDGDFMDAGEMAFQANGNDVINGTITIPMTANLGDTRMRISMKQGAYAEPCETFTLGEVQDYTVTLQMQTSGLIRPEILQLYAEKDGRTGRIYWVSNTPEKDATFELEHSFDGEQFALIKTQTAYNNRSEGELTRYETREADLSKGDHYYRLRQHFQDGTTRLSAVKKLHFPIDLQAVQCYPNPTTGALYIALDAYQGKAADIAIYNALGQPIYAQHYDVLPTEPLSVDLKMQRAGVYLVRVKVAGLREMTEKVVLVGW